MHALQDLSSFQRDLLTFLAANNGTNGLEARDSLEEIRDEYISHTRIYRNIYRLEDVGLIRREEVTEQENRYIPTDKAIRNLKSDLEWRKSLLDGVEESVDNVV